MRRTVTILAAGLAVGGFCSPAQGQIGRYLANGTGIDPVTTAAYWVVAPTDVRSLVVADLVLLSQNPLNSPLAMLAIAGQTRPLPADLVYPPGAMTSNPGGMFNPRGMPGPSPGSGGGGGGGSGGGSGGRRGAGGMPESTPSGLPAEDPAGAAAFLPAGGLPPGPDAVPVRGLWMPEPDPGVSSFASSSPGGSGTGPTIDETITKTNPPGPVDTPEPATAVLALVGLAGVGLVRQRRVA